MFRSKAGSDSKPPVLEGYLKMPVILNQYSKRYVELFDDQMVWFADKKGLKFGSLKITNRTELKDTKEKPFSFAIISERCTMYFTAASDHDKQNWKTKLHSVIEVMKRDGGNRLSTPHKTVSQAVQTRPIVHVKVIQARDLSALDPGGFSDPYVKCMIGSSLSQTTVKKKNLNPQWGMIFDFDRTRSLRYAKFEVYDQDKLSADDHLGTVMVPLLSMRVGQANQPEWYRLEKRSSKEVRTGELELEINLEYEFEDSRQNNLLHFFDEVRMLPDFNLNILGENNKIFPCCFPPRQLEMLEDATVSCSMYMRSISGKVYCKGMLFLTNYRLIFLSLPRLYEICNLAQNRKMLLDLIKDDNFDFSTQIPLGNIIEILYQKKLDKDGIMSDFFKIRTTDNRLLKFVYINDIDYSLPSSDTFERRETVIEQEVSNLEISFCSLMSETPHEIDALDSDEGSPFARISKRLEMIVLNKNVLNHHMAKIHGKMLDAVRECIELKTQENEPANPHASIGESSSLPPQLPMGWSADGEISFHSGDEYSLTAFHKNINDLTLETLETLSENFRVGWMCYDPVEEYKRMHVPDWLWRLTTVNEKHELCPTYPAVLAVPNSEEITDDVVRESAHFRSKGRIPVLAWRNCTGENNCTIMRCAQPLVGLTSARSASDELLVEWANYCGGDMAIRRFVTKEADFNPRTEKVKPFFIFDARPLLNAQANQVGGRGFESNKNYKNCEILFMDISNIHAVRQSLDILEKGILEDENTWLKALDSSLWLLNIRKILIAALKIVQCVRIENISVLVHCSDGWDRTAQLTSLAMLLSDPYYRTLRGFAILVEKEWVSFGHKFGERLGWGEKGADDQEKSPVFLQFLDCVHQCLLQEGLHFEFTESLLIFIAEHLNSGWFGNFLFECHKELEKCKPNTISIWTYVLNNSELFLNPNFSPTSAPIIPVVSQHRIVFWSGWFMRWHDKIWKAEYRNEIMIRATGGEDTLMEYVFLKDSSRTAEAKGGGTSGGGGGGGGMSTATEIAWMDDKAASGCKKCSKTFSLFRRKHHCRKCGYVFCENCSPTQRVVQGQMARCCIDCAAKIDNLGESSRMSANLTGKKIGGAQSDDVSLDEV